MPYVRMEGSDGREWFFRWSRVTDSPASEAMTQPELVAQMLREGQARAGIRRALHRLRCSGTTALRDKSARDTIEPVNRAGAGETWLTAEQQLELVIRWRDDPEAEIEGVAQDMICCMCCRPIATVAERVWTSDEGPVDPMCGSCASVRSGREQGR